MNNKFKIIETEDYFLAVSDEEIKVNDWYWIPIKMSIEQCIRKILIIKEGVNDIKQLKIIAYLPKNNAKELDDLPLLPEIIVEDDVEKLPYDKLCYYDARNPDNVLSPLREGESEESSYQEEGIDFAAKGCMCDNCFYGRTDLATQIIKIAHK